MDSKRQLKGMLARIFSDATVDAGERTELRAFLASGVLTNAELQEVFDDFVQTTWKITIADNVVTDIEKKRLREIVAVLGLSSTSLPAEWKRVLGS